MRTLTAVALDVDRSLFNKQYWGSLSRDSSPVIDRRQQNICDSNKELLAHLLPIAAASDQTAMLCGSARQDPLHGLLGAIQHIGDQYYCSHSCTEALRAMSQALKASYPEKVSLDTYLLADRVDGETFQQIQHNYQFYGTAQYNPPQDANRYEPFDN